MTTFSPQPKPTKTRKQGQDARRLAIKKHDKSESVKVVERSGGQCELVVLGWRCSRPGEQVHHMLEGIGVRGRVDSVKGDSASRDAKIHLCKTDHDWWHANPGAVSWLDAAHPFETIVIQGG